VSETKISKRVARGIHEAISQIPWSDLSETSRRITRVAAVGAIAAMRGPTEAMIDAAHEKWNRGPGTSLDNKDADARHCWQTMIDAALRDQ